MLEQVAAGAIVTITVNGRPVAEMRSPAGAMRPSLGRAEVRDLAWISDDTTDDLEPLT